MFVHTSWGTFMKSPTWVAPVVPGAASIITAAKVIARIAGNISGNSLELDALHRLVDVSRSYRLDLVLQIPCGFGG